MIKFKVMMVFILLLTAFTLSKDSNRETENKNFPVLKGDYLGQTPPGMNPELFAPGIVSTKEKSEINSVFSPNGNEFYFSRGEPRGKDKSGKVIKIWTIKCMKRINDRWTRPKTAPFSGKYKDANMSVSHDGYRFFFCSDRPFPGSRTLRKDLFIWFMVRTKTGWSEHCPIDHPINTGLYSLHPTMTYNGTIYFTSGRDDTIGEADIYRSRFVNGSYTTPENLGSAINSKYVDGDALIASDERFIIVTCVGRPENFGKQDLYIGFRKKDGSWTKLKNMGKPINSELWEGSPMLSPDGKYLFFTSGRNGDRGDIYWLDAKVIKTYKPGN